MGMAENVFGETARELLVRDEDGLLVAMSSDNNILGLKFLSALRAFEKRYLYANVRNDFMVKYVTAAFEPSVQIMSGAEVEYIVQQGWCENEVQAVHMVEEDYDEKGCRIFMRFRY